MTKTDPAKLNELRQTISRRFSSLIFYQRLCHFFAYIALIPGVVYMCVAVVAYAGTARLEPSPVTLAHGGIALVTGIWTFLMLEVAANTILAVVDVAVNSHLQVYLLNEDD